MEDGNATSFARGNGDRRSTVSGAIPQLSDREERQGKQNEEAIKFPRSSPSAPSSPTVGSFQTSPKPAIHRRTFSGNFFAKFNNLLKTSTDDASEQPTSPKSRKSIDDDSSPISPVSPVKGESAMAAALKPVKTRKRKGSLRKTALLGGKRAATEGRERKNSLLQRSTILKQPPMPLQEVPPLPPVFIEDDVIPPSHLQQESPRGSIHKQFSYEHVNAASSDSGWTDPTALTAPRLSLLTEPKLQQARRESADSLESSVETKSPVSQSSHASYASTTDDDDVLTFDRPGNNYSAAQRETILPKKPLGSTATSYFPSVTSVSEPPISRRRSSQKSRSSPLSHNMTTLSNFAEPEPHDYTETEYWGWVILFVTWLTFTVGMGSCLEIWSWAWDVGETPYAPPELEDDPTLPIVGYYPALIVLTGVVAWIWITVAWVGMKYFRHAKIEV